MSVNASSETDYYAASATRSVFQYLPVAYKDGENLKAREEMGIAAHYGGISFNKAGLGYVHAIAHQLGAFYSIPHGRANAIVLPHILDANRDVCEQRLATLAKKTGVVDNVQAKADDGQLADYLIAQVRALIEETNIDRSVAGINEDDFVKIAKAAAIEVRDTYSVPRYFTQAEIVKILHDIKDISDSLNQ
ncbi:iron-containing alcohol dehydrogenase [Psychrobacter phenylpyruvicus]|uniref:1,3-propanediol dehydrogenase n=3 Tax=Psychrobacter phenylpyruvicus TaxID=29432 RepID=A0A379LNT2_9GAMM|nr:1,3-propanediol dehydrogenase [Psychrobacter phenylpyruvicus]